MPVLLHKWDTLIGSTLNPSNINLDSLDDESIQFFVNESDAEREKVRLLLIEGIVDRPKISDKQQFVQVNQAMLTRLLDKLYSYKQTKGLDEKIITLYNGIRLHLEYILNFIEDFFSNYFDRNEKVPKSYLIISNEELSKQLELLKQAAQPYEAYVHAIVNILVNNFSTFCLQKTNSCTYNELMYQKALMNELLTDKTLASEKSIKEVLLYFNYNDDDYIAYLYEKLNALTEFIPTKKEKIAALRFEQKKINQITTKPNCALSSTMPSLKDQINHWIEEEIKYLEIEETPLITNPTSDDAEKGPVYVHVAFKGSEIYLLHKAFIDSGGAPAETYKSLFEKTGSHLTNKNQKGFSTESLQKSSDKVNYEAKENVKRFLQKMIRNIDSY